MGADEEGVLGNLPRSRPGRRSQKRSAPGGKRVAKGAAGAKPAGKGAKRAARAPAGAKRAARAPAGAKRPSAAATRAAESAESRGTPAAREAPGIRAERTARRTGPAAAVSGGAESGKATSPRGTDPVGGAVRTAAKVAETGLKMATGLTREVIRRLPRP